MPDQDFYRRLGVRRRASQEEIRAAFRRLAKRLHPDVDRTRGAHDRFLAVKEAYEVLSNPLLRREYDDRYRPLVRWDTPRRPVPRPGIRVSPPFVSREPRAVRVRSGRSEVRRCQIAFAYTAVTAGSSVAFLGAGFLMVALGGLLPGILSFMVGIVLVLLLLHVAPSLRRP